MAAHNGLALRLRCKLIMGSIFSFINVPPLLLSLCERFGVMTRTEALFRARILPTRVSAQRPWHDLAHTALQQVRK